MLVALESVFLVHGGDADDNYPLLLALQAHSRLFNREHTFCVFRL